MLTSAVGWVSLLAAITCLVTSLILALERTDERKAVKAVTVAMAEKAKESAKDGQFQQQAGALSTSLEGVAKLATALKDLDRVGQFLVVALGFAAIAGVVAGLEEVAQAVGG